MAAYWYERLSVQDSSFLVFEDAHTHMHLGGIMILDAPPLASSSGGVDIDRIRAYIASRLPFIPRYRQRLAHIPIENYPVWVDDAHFNLKYHVRHTSLPRPGDERQLKRLAGRIMSQQLDRGKPLWEAWIVEGLEGNRCAIITKAHHCMVDGIASVDLVTVLLRPDPSPRIEPVAEWTPRSAPTRFELLRDEALRRTQTPIEIARSVSSAVQDLGGTVSRVTEQLSAAWALIRAGVRMPADTPLNRPIGPHRRFDWLTLDLNEVKAVKNRLGGTVNDVVLATVAGAIRRFLRERGVDVDTLDYRAVIPVSVRGPEEHGAMGNRVSAWLTSLPIHEADPRRRLATVSEMTAYLKESRQAQGTQLLTKLGEWAGSGLMTLGVRLTARLHPFNLIVTNVPGPPMPLYLLGARLLDGYPQVPLFESQSLGMALFSYAGKLCWGFNADYDLLPDLHDVVTATAAAFRELYDAAHGEVAVESATARRRSRTRGRAGAAGGAANGARRAASRSRAVSNPL